MKLQVSFAENGLFYKALLQKRPVILSILLPFYTDAQRLSVSGCIQTPQK